MSAAIDDEDLSLTIAQNRRNSKEAAPPAHDDAESARSALPADGLEARTASTTSASRKDPGRLGQYNVIRTLGEGSFGKVKLAIHRVSGQKVALKIIARQKLVTRDMAGRIEREIQYLQLLRHPHIIKLFTVITTPKDIIMVLEYAGGELFDYIVQNGKMAEDKARKFFQQIVCAVEYCHRHKIVHRDLKPENLLLDEQLNVKIADFGLSNIMTDGNFLKTSCGSPNYAAPEVISGKLYAGPEVDVWSCGVILYVLLVGRLPFDDEYIPALFKKIAQGNYQVPNYLSSGAVRLIRKMLQVNPVNRITVEEIRQDPWFMKDLPEYLQPPVEDFIDTGVDPNRAIDPFALSKSKPKPVQEKLHNAVVGKLGKTMGYAPDDVQEALKKDEPSAIKDAYLIVRENTLMKTNPSLAVDQPAFMAQSPPTFVSSGFRAGTPLGSSLGSKTNPTPPPVNNARHNSTSSSIMDARSPANTIAILPSSLPDYHAAYMKGQHMPAEKSTPDPDQGAPTEPSRPRTKEEQEAMVRRLKPHSRSQANLHRHHHEKPEPMTALSDATTTKTTKKSKPTKWQFGIRSRNTPAEAMLAIYKALRKMGAVWEVPRPKEPGVPASGEVSPDRSHSRRERQEGEESPEYSDSDPEAGTDPEYATHSDQERRRARRRQEKENDGSNRSRFSRWNDWGYELPEDPWVIAARFRKSGMWPPGVAPPGSTHSSRVDLTYRDTEELRRRASVISAASANGGDVAMTGPAAHSASTSTLGQHGAEAKESVWVYVTIQLYSIEKDFYLVDFKCAGYERLARRFAKEMQSHMSGSNAGSGSPAPEMAKTASGGEEEKEEDDAEEEGDEEGEVLVGMGRTAEEKEISSPFPFLDVCSRLIIQLAEAND